VKSSVVSLVFHTSLLCLVSLVSISVGAGHGWPKRWRYSLDDKEMLFTISA